MLEALLLIPGLADYLELIPICVIGLLAGSISFFNKPAEGTKQWKIAIKSIITSSFLAVVSYAILSATNLPYLASVGIATAIAYFGVQDSLELIKQLLSLRNGNDTKKKE